MAHSLSKPSSSAPFGAVALLALSALGGCATGSTASFTMAPLIFAEQTDASGEAVPAAATVGDEPALAPYGTFDRGIVHYVSVGGNAVLPVNALRPPSLATGTDTGTDIALATAGPALPGSLDATLLGGIAPATQGGLAIAGLAAAGQGAQAQATVTAAPASLATSVPIAAAASVAAGPASVAAVSQALIVSTPMLSGSAVAPAGPGTTNLLTASASNMVRMCLLKGCR